MEQLDIKDTLGNELKQKLEDGISARQAREARYRRNRSFYFNDPPGVTSAFEGAADWHWPVVQPVLDTLTANVVGTITSRAPFLVAQCGNKDAGLFVQQLLQFFAEKDGLKYSLAKASPCAGYTNTSWVKSEWNKDRVGFKFKSLEPFSCFVHPVWADNLDDATVFGDVFYRTRADVEAQKKKELYKSDKVLAAGQKEDAESATGDMGGNSRPLDVTAIKKADDMIELWDLIYRDGDNVRQIILARENGEILRDEVFDKGDKRYIELVYKEKNSIDGYWSSYSVAQDMQSLQIQANDLVTDFSNGQKMAMYGAVFMKEGLDSGSAIERFAPGEILKGNIDNMQIYSPKIDLSPIMPLLQLCVSQAQEVARVGPNARGVGDANSDTATESEYARMGQQVSIDDYIETFGGGVINSYSYMQGVLLAKFDEWFDLYKEDLDLEDEKKEEYRMWLGYKVIWRLNVSSIGAAPAMQLAMVRSIADLAQDPEYGFDKYKIGERMAELQEAIGLPDAKDLQYPRDISEASERFAAQFDIDPDVMDMALRAAFAVQNAVDQEGMAGMAGQPAGVSTNGAPALPTGDQSQVAGNVPA